MTHIPPPSEWPAAPVPSHGLKDPVRTVRQLSRFEYARRRPRTRVDHALVLVTAQGTYDTFLPPHRPRRSDATTKHYIALYEVDMGLHPVRVELSLPSAIDAFQFEAVADLTWQVTEPAAVIDCGVRDVPALLGPRLGHILRQASRLHQIHSVRAAETAVQQSFSSAPPLAAAEGLTVHCTVRLHTDQGERSQSERLRTAHHEASATPPEHRIRMEALRRDLEAQEYERRMAGERIKFYEEQLAKGGVAMLVLHLVQHPQDTALVMENLRKEQTDLVANQLHLVDQILSEHGLERYQMEEPKEHVAETINRVLTQPSPGRSPNDSKAVPSTHDTGTGMERSEP
ncbi:hypothetical protein OG292_14800 [Streptomyces sp. NBC_01511]|uniref:hypothetical protein n=1 Tax=Streptomyces sp. NBC_01511 TaxID=2903889 RepID=UPI003869A7D1